MVLPGSCCPVRGKQDARPPTFGTRFVAEQLGRRAPRRRVSWKDLAGSGVIGDMSTLRSRIEQRLRERIEAAEAAKACAGGKLDLGPLFGRLDDLIAVVEGIRDYSVEPYMERVREVICATCRQDASGRCVTRDADRCGLERYFDLIVAVVENELKHDPGLPQTA